MKRPRRLKMRVEVSGADDGFGWRVYGHGRNAMIVGPLAKTRSMAIKRWDRLMSRLFPEE